MKELCRTNDMALISYIEAVLRDADIAFMVADTHMSVVEGSLGILPRRVLVDADDWRAAARLLKEAGVGIELSAP